MCRRVFLRFSRALSTGRLAFLRRVVALRAACAGLAVLLCVAQSHLGVSTSGREHARRDARSFALLWRVGPVMWVAARLRPGAVRANWVAWVV